MEKPNEPQKSIWKKSWKGPRGFMLWGTLLVAATFLVVFGIGLFVRMGTGDSLKFATVGAIAVGAAVTVGLAVFLIRWLSCWRNLRRALFGLACLLTLVAFFYVEEDVRGNWAWNNFKHEWEAKGEKFDLGSFIPSAVPEEQNFAMAPMVASSYASMLDKNGHEIKPRNTNIINRMALDVNRDNNWNDMPTNGNWAKATITDLQPWQTYYRTAQTNKQSGMLTNEFPIAAKPQTPAEDVLLALSKYDSDVEELRRESQLPDSRFPLEYDKDDPAAILLPHLAALKRCALFLQLRAIAELQHGDTDHAASDIKLMLRLTDAARSEPFLISHLVRVAMLNLTLQPIYEGLAEHKWSDAQLTTLDPELAKLNFLADHRRTMRSEAAFTVRMIDYVRRTRNINEYLDLFNDRQRGGPVWDHLFSVIPSGWFRQNQVRFSKFYIQQCLPVTDPENRTFSPKAAQEAQANREAAIAHPTPYNMFQRIFLSPAESWFSDADAIARKFAYAQESADLARVAIALERFRLARGDYPESLDTIAPQFMEKIPHDIIGGQPLKYRKTSDAFVLYSIGWNEKDDGGILAVTKADLSDQKSSKRETGDWVWQYPAK